LASRSVNPDLIWVVAGRQTISVPVSQEVVQSDLVIVSARVRKPVRVFARARGSLTIKASVCDQVRVRITSERQVNPLESGLRDIVSVLLDEVLADGADTQGCNIHGSSACGLSTTFSSGRDHICV
jgi:hypothetical protein